MGKKLSRSRRRELREQGVLEQPRLRAAEPERTAPRAAAEPSSSRAPAARADEIEDEAPLDPPAKARATNRDRTVLVLFALTAAAALIFWLTQRSPKKDTKMIDVPPPMGAPSGHDGGRPPKPPGPAGSAKP